MRKAAIGFYKTQANLSLQKTENKEQNAVLEKSNCGCWSFLKKSLEKARIKFNKFSEYNKNKIERDWKYESCGIIFQLMEC